MGEDSVDISVAGLFCFRLIFVHVSWSSSVSCQSMGEGTMAWQWLVQLSRIGVASRASLVSHLCPGRAGFTIKLWKLR
jgi:hypothetical protein